MQHGPRPSADASLICGLLAKYLPSDCLGLMCLPYPICAHAHNAAQEWVAQGVIEFMSCAFRCLNLGFIIRQKIARLPMASNSKQDEAKKCGRERERGGEMQEVEHLKYIAASFLFYSQHRARTRTSLRAPYQITGACLWRKA